MINQFSFRLRRLNSFNKIRSVEIRQLSISIPRASNSKYEELAIKVPWGVVAGKKCGEENEGEGVLCLHGWLDNCNTFDNLLPSLPKDKFYVSIDFPGHGRSSHIHHGTFYLWHHYVDVVERIRRSFKWKTFSILGHSLGANVGALYSSTFPEKVNRLIMIDTLGIHPYPFAATADVLRKSIEGYLKFEEAEVAEKQYTYEAAKQRLMSGNEDLSEGSAEILLERGLKKLDNGKFTFARDFRQVLLDPHYLSPEHVFVLLPNIQADILRITAREGYVKKYMRDEFKKIHGQLLKCYDACRHYESVTVEGNHHVHLNNPEHVSQIVHDFMTRPVRHRGDGDVR